MISFSQDRWKEIKKNASDWWADKLGRPLIQVRLFGKEPDRSKAKYPYYEFTSFYDSSISPEEIVDAWDYQLCCIEHLGDAFPVVIPNFGPGTVAAYAGANLQNGNGTVWLHPDHEIKLNELDFEYSPENYWFKRTKDLLKAANEYWLGNVQIAMTDLGGNMDVLSTFRPGEQLIFDIMDQPENVQKLIWESHEIWWLYFNELNCIIHPCNPGYSSWARIFSEQPHYMLQCDFSFMIGPDLFERFVKPELVATSKKLENTFYHLDGPGQLKHLDSILEIDSIKGIQWIPGAGQPDMSHWPEVYKKISDAGKKIHIISSLTEEPFTLIDKISQQTGRVDNIVYHLDGEISQKHQVTELLKKYNCE